MQGILEKARQARAVALDKVAQARDAIDHESSDQGVGTTAGGYTAVGNTDAALMAALKKVTHSGTATVPREALREVERLADESEDSLAIVLKHVEENLRVPSKEWRTIHGALKLLEHLMRGSEKEASLVGKMWYEVKVQVRLQELDNFSHNEDSRVAMLISRTAAAVRRTAETTILADQDQESPGSTSPPGWPLADAEADTSFADMLAKAEPREPSNEAATPEPREPRESRDSGDEQERQRQRERERQRESDQKRPSRKPSEVTSSSSVDAQVIGRPNSASIPDDVSDGGPDDIEAALSKAAEMREKRSSRVADVVEHPGPSTPSSTSTSGGMAQVRPPRRCCSCFWKSAQGTSTQSKNVAHPSEVASLMQ